MIKDREITINEGGVRLDAALLVEFPSATRAFVKAAIAEGDILVNGSRASKGMKLKGGERVYVRQLLEAKDNLVCAAGECPRPVYEDAALLAFDKPAGMPVQPLTCRETGTLMNSVVTQYPECRALGGELLKLGESPLMAGALHRIDADTSGLVLVARTLDCYRNLRDQFSAQTVKKTYLAMVEGSVAVGGTLKNELIHDPTLPFCKMIDVSRARFAIKQKPLPAVTAFKPIGHTTVENESRTLLEVTIYTGVTHQIRAQLAIAGMHIINDRLYGAFAVENQIGHCLHAYAAEFQHPLTGAAAIIKTPRPSWCDI